MSHRHLSLAALALALGACSAETVDHPLAPTAPSLARQGTELPFHGAVDAMETHQFDVASNRVLIHLVGDGTATHVGRYGLAMDLGLDPATGTAVGQLVLTAADGSTLIATVTGQGTLANGLFSIAETATITGGTGRFAGAAGSFDIERTVVAATLVSSGSFDGNISLGK